MKKILTLLLALSMAFVLVSCDDEYVEDYESEEYEQEDMSSDSDMTISDYINENYEAMVNQVGDLSNEGMTFEVYEQDNSLYYVYTFTDPLNDVAATQVKIEETIDSNVEVYTSICENLFYYVPSASAFVVEYYTSDGEFITAREFSY